ncbi:MAG: peptidylprolyl isomerase [Betaproteobacteria bacterium]|nr:peptidylprolyl isomerase [Betaproteobacteria bacterium]
MFEFIRTHQRLMQFLLLLIIVPAFAIGFGMQGWNPAGDPNAVAKVCGGTVSMQDFERAQQEYLQNMRQQLGANFRPEFFDNPEARGAILDRLVNQRALACAALKRNIVASDDLLRQNILHDKQFQIDGKFSNELYQGALANNGMSSSAYETLLRQQLAMQALSSGVLMTASSPQTVQALFARAQEEQREVQELVLKPELYTAQVKLAPDAAQKYYDANQKEFQVPPQLRAEYLVLSVDTLSASIAPDAAEVRKYYDQNQNRYGVPEERQARHILIPAAAGAPAAEIAAARTKAEGILTQLKADPNKFPQLAKEFSKDPGSAEKGGELDFAAHNGTFVKPFEDKLFALKQGEVSDLVQTDYGFHIIQLMAVKPSSVKPFEQVRAEIEADWKKQRAQKLYADSIDGFADIVYTQPDSLKPAADKYKLTVQSAPLFARGAPPKDLNNPNLLTKLFGDEAVKNKRNTEAVEVAPGMMVSARVAEYKPQSVRPFAEAQAGITAMLTQREARALAKKDGEAKLKAAKASPDFVGFGAARTLSRAKPEGTGQDGMRMIMGAPKDKLPAVVGGELAEGGYAIYRINKVSQPDKPDPALAASLKTTLERSQAESDFNAYLAALKLTAKIELHPENIEKKPAN